MRGATSATSGSLKCPSITSSQPGRGTTSESRNATNSVVAARNPALRAAAGPRETSWRSTVISHPIDGGAATGVDEPSSTTTIRCPRSDATSLARPSGLSRSGTTMVTSSTAGVNRGRGLATPESSKRRATRAVC